MKPNDLAKARAQNFIARDPEGTQEFLQNLLDTQLTKTDEDLAESTLPDELLYNAVKRKVLLELKDISDLYVEEYRAEDVKLRAH